MEKIEGIKKEGGNEKGGGKEPSPTPHLFSRIRPCFTMKGRSIEILIA